MNKIKIVANFEPCGLLWKQHKHGTVVITCKTLDKLLYINKLLRKPGNRVCMKIVKFPNIALLLARPYYIKNTMIVNNNCESTR